MKDISLEKNLEALGLVPGQTQFMPSTFKKFAIDFDENNKINLFEKGDALASGANYLNKVGWNNKIKWGKSKYSNK